MRYKTYVTKHHDCVDIYKKRISKQIAKQVKNYIYYSLQRVLYVTKHHDKVDNTRKTVSLCGTSRIL